MFKKALPFLLAIAALLLPELASAQSVLKPLDGNSWTLYVFGNGDAIFNILNAIKLLMVPDSGSTGFNSLMMFLATVGFLVLAVQAGFDPGKNLLKMFSYILVVSAVHITTMNIRANILISDPVTNYENVVEGVPALVGVPAALVSEIGHWFTKTVETYYTIPSELTVTGGTFNLFGRLMQESNEYVIVNPELKKSLSAYTADCVVPAMARGTLTASDLMTSPNMTTTLSLATHKAILTKYWPVGKPSTTGTGMSYPTELTYGGETYPVEGGLGAVIPCDAAWSYLSKDMDLHAQELMDATAKQWSKTGVLVPFETGMSVAMSMASSGGANPFANYSKPQGYILQQAMLNSMNGSFRSAAAAIGNNDIMMSAAIAQAEQSQKSSWFTAARVFSNMMGYVYTTLQAFIFAIVPIVVIALMVPGLGKAIFTNYAQILVWLMLWQPMLSIVNFLVTLFGKAQISSTLELAAGVTMQNKFALSENTNDLMLAAQFLGTMVPLLTWGLVKGSLAFTEFISHGIGSSMAQQAGATAATGNMSMGNLSMDNTSMNKFNTAMSAAVGNQTTIGYTGGAMTSSDSGGDAKQEMGGSVTNVMQSGLTKAEKASASAGANASKSATDSLTALESLMKGKGLDVSNSAQFQAAATAVQKLSETAQHAKDSGQSEAAKQADATAQKLALSMVQSAQANAKLGIAPPKGLGMMLKGLGINTGVDFNWSTAKQKQEAMEALSSAETSLSRSLSEKYGITTQTGKDVQNSTGATNTNQTNRTERLSHDWSAQTAKQVQDAIAASKSISSGLDFAANSSVTLGGSGRATFEQMQQLHAMSDRLHDEVPAQIAAIRAETTAATAGVTDPTGAAVTGRIEANTNAHDNSPAQAALAGTAGGVTRGAPTQPTAAPGQKPVDLEKAHKDMTDAAINDRQDAQGALGTTQAAVAGQRQVAEETTRPLVPVKIGDKGDYHGHRAPKPMTAKQDGGASGKW